MAREGREKINSGAYGEDLSPAEDFAYLEPENAVEAENMVDAMTALQEQPRWEDAPRPPDLSPPKAAADDAAPPSRRGPNGRVTPSAADLGPCLYFGPAGERCDRRAVSGSFCSRHQPAPLGSPTAGRSLSIPQVSKRALGAAGIIAVLWPILADLIREILRLLH